ncbi:MAG: YcgN family cysteine cluster protein [Alphaproteobacteria bacterium]
MTETPFWKKKSLAQMTRTEWESLCDGCGQCCLHKLQDVDTGDYYVTDISCRLLDCRSGKCSDYANRKTHVPDCVQLNARSVFQTDWLPETCAYRLVADGKDLEWWHPLVSGSDQTVHEAGISVRGKAVAGDPTVDEMTQRIQRTLAAILPGKG